MKRRFLFILVILALVLSACGGGGEKSIVRIGWAGSPDNLNPGMGILTESYTIYGLVYDTMYNLNLDGSFTLSIADSVVRSDDCLVYTFKIKDGI